MVGVRGFEPPAPASRRLCWSLLLCQTLTAIAPSKARIILTWSSAEDQQSAKANGHKGWAVFDENGAYLSDGIDSRYATIGMIAVNLNQVLAGNWRKPETDGCLTIISARRR